MPKRLVFIFLLLFSPLWILTGCTPVGLALTAGATAGSVILETRSFDDSMKDRGLQVAINKAIADQNLKVFSAVSIDVVEGRALLTGIVSKREDRLNVAKITWAQSGVEEVVNEIRISQTIDIIDVSKDTWIKTQIFSAITFDSQVFATNYEISVIGGYVYLFGISVDDAEVERVIAHAREVPSVRRVISHMRNQDDPVRLARIKRIEVEKTK